MSTYECAYCGYEIDGETDYQGVSLDPVPDLDDDDAWETLAPAHAEDCEWIVTRAQQRNP